MKLPAPYIAFAFTLSTKQFASLDKSEKIYYRESFNQALLGNLTAVVHRYTGNINFTASQAVIVTYTDLEWDLNENFTITAQIIFVSDSVLTYYVGNFVSLRAPNIEFTEWFCHHQHFKPAYWDKYWIEDVQSGFHIDNNFRKRGRSVLLLSSGHCMVPGSDTFNFCIIH